MRAYLVLLLLAVPLLALPACRRFTKEGADREVYGLLAKRRAHVEEVRGTLDLESKERLADAIRAREAFNLTLRDALELATVSSREYRRQREAVYIAALALTRELNQFRPLWDASGSADFDVDADDSTLGANMNTILSRAFERGGGLVISLANSFLTDITGNPLRVAQSILNADITLPLLRGAGTLVAREPLRQAENDLLYALRDYALFQQRFTVDIATRFYRALQDRDGWKNAETRYESLTKLVTEQREQAGAGRLPNFEVDQVEQDLLQSDDARQRRRNTFERSVDALKLDIGIPVGVDVVLADSDLERLRTEGPQPAPFGQAVALAQATRLRLDLRTARDAQKDAERRVLVARDALRAGLDLRAGGTLDTPRDRPFDFSDTEGRGNIGLDFDLPLERTAERNTYRRAIIDAGRARRERQRVEDQVVFEVRDAYRTLAGAVRSYEIQKESARLADRRVESTQLLLERGTVRTRDRLDAEDSRVVARNAVTGALVDHALARLALERDVGSLTVDAQGMWAPEAPAADLPGSSAAQRATRADADTPISLAPPRAEPIQAAPLPGANGRPFATAPVVRGTRAATAAPITSRRRPAIHAAPLAAGSRPRSGPQRPQPAQPGPGFPPPKEQPSAAPRPSSGNPARTTPASALPPAHVGPRRSGTVGAR